VPSLSRSARPIGGCAVVLELIVCRVKPIWTASFASKVGHFENPQLTVRKGNIGRGGVEIELHFNSTSPMLSWRCSRLFLQSVQTVKMLHAFEAL
jgi:hypothetical protein